MRAKFLVGLIAGFVLFAGVLFTPRSIDGAQKGIDFSKLKRGDKLEYRWINEWQTVEFLQRETFNRVKIRFPDTGWERTVSADEVRLPAAVKKKLDNKNAAAHPDNPFATSEEKSSAVKPRTWSDKSGKFKIEGTLVRIDGDKVVLQRSDQQEITVPLDKLSDADQKYVADYKSGRAPGPPGKNAPATDDDPAQRTLLPLTPTDLNSAKLVSVDGLPEWVYKPDNAPDTVVLRDVRVGLQPVDFFAKATKLLLLPQDKKAYVIFKNGRHGKSETSLVQACDLGRGKLEGVAVFGVDELPIAISPDGKYVLSSTDGFGFGKRSELRLYSREGKKVDQIACWQPYNHHRSPFSKHEQKPNEGNKKKTGFGFGDSEESPEEPTDDNTRPELWAEADVEWAEFIDNEHVLTMGNAGELAMWKVPEIEPLYVMKGRISQPALSPGRNYLAVSVGKGIVILNARDGDVAGLIPLASDNSSGSIAFRRDGKRLVLVQGGQWSRVRIWDLESREIVRDFAVRDVTAGWMTNATWTSDDHLLTGSTVIDVARRIPIWRYTGLNDAWQFYGDKAWYIAEGLGRDNQVLASAKVPPKGAIDAVAKLNPEDLLVIHPGLEVEVDLQGGEAKDLEMARAAVLKRLQENDMRIVPESKLKLVGRIQPGETKAMKYIIQERPIGAPRIPPSPFGQPYAAPGQKVSEQSVTEQILSLSFERDGRSVWKYQQRTTPPLWLTIPPDQTLEQTLAEHMQQNAKSFGQIWVPSYVAEVPGGEGQKNMGATP